MNLTTVHIHTVARRVVSTTVLAIFFGVFSAGAAPTATDFPVEEIREHLMNTESIVEPRFNSTVRGHIVTYLKLNRDKTQRLLDRSMMYFPLIEEYLDAYDLPDELKYLAIVESALVPRARSRAGAVGLWQFMSFTGREHGLRIYSSVDERMDPVRSTDAAMRYLSRLYKEFDDWALAMAAYNSGPGRVRSAIRRSGSRDFWILQRYLPRETRGYIPKFVAAAYVFKHFEEHGFLPALPDLDLHFTEAIQVYQKLSFTEISKWTGIEKHKIAKLNPSYRYHYVPASSNGYTLILPSRVVPIVMDKLEQSGTEYLDDSKDASKANSTEKELEYIFTSYIATPDESIFEVAQKFELNPYQLKYWNIDKVKETGSSARSLDIPIVYRQKLIMERVMQEERLLDAIDIQLDMPPLQYLSIPNSNMTVSSGRSKDTDVSATAAITVRLNRGESLEAVMRRQRKRFDTIDHTKYRFIRYGQKIAISD